MRARELPSVMRNLQLLGISKRQHRALMSGAIDLRESSKHDQALREGLS